jgi:hypothetical protein
MSETSYLARGWVKTACVLATARLSTLPYPCVGYAIIAVRCESLPSGLHWRRKQRRAAQRSTRWFLIRSASMSCEREGARSKIVALGQGRGAVRVTVAVNAFHASEALARAGVMVAYTRARAGLRAHVDFRVRSLSVSPCVGTHSARVGVRGAPVSVSREGQGLLNYVCRAGWRPSRRAGEERSGRFCWHKRTCLLPSLRKWVTVIAMSTRGDTFIGDCERTRCDVITRASHEGPDVVWGWALWEHGGEGMGCGSGQEDAARRVVGRRVAG